MRYRGRRWGSCIAAFSAILGFVGLSAGCVPYRAQPLDPWASVQQLAGRRMTDASVHDAIVRAFPGNGVEWPPSAWDRAQLFALALAQNPQILLSKANEGLARAREVTAAQAHAPELTLQSEYARHDAHPWLYGVSLAWMIRSGGQRRLDIHAAGLGTDIARLQSMDQIWSVRRSMTAALSDWQCSVRRLENLDRIASSYERLVDVARRRVSAGEEAAESVLLVEQSRLQIDHDRHEERQRSAASQAEVARALGMTPAALDGFRWDWKDWGEIAPVDPGHLPQIRERALLSRPDLAAAIQEYAIAETRLQQAVDRQRPQLVLEPGYYWDHGIAKFPFDVGLTIPINGNRAEIGEARAQRNVAAQRMLALQADILVDMDAAERAEGIARTDAANAERSVEAARVQLNSVKRAVDAGSLGSIDELSAEIQELRAELELIDQRGHLQRARNALEDVIRMPLSGPELTMNEAT